MDSLCEEYRMYYLTHHLHEINPIEFSRELYLRQ